MTYGFSIAGADGRDTLHRLDELAERRRRWREAGASSDEIARWSEAWLNRQPVKESTP